MISFSDILNVNLLILFDSFITELLAAYYLPGIVLGTGRDPNVSSGLRELVVVEERDYFLLPSKDKNVIQIDLMIVVLRSIMLSFFPTEELFWKYFLNK